MNNAKNFLKTLFPRFYSSKIGLFLRNKIGERIDFRAQEAATEYISGLLNKYDQGDIDELTIKPRQTLDGQRMIIWQFWWQGNEAELPPLTKLSFRSVDKFKGEFQVIRLDRYSIHKYLSIPNSIIEKVKNQQFSIAAFSDLLRIALLYYYGGVWIDATVVLTNELDKKYLLRDYFLFHRKSLPKSEKKIWYTQNRFYFNWHPRHKVKLLNGFFCVNARKPSDLYCFFRLLNYYWCTEKRQKHYFFFQILFNELYEKGYIKDYLIEESDTIPHQLLLRLEQEFNELEYRKIINLTHVHVFRHHVQLKKGSFYEHVINSIDEKLLDDFTKKDV
ncbi:capsular polysaccharide synthesis protein [Mannheimia varigena]|uniref:capsular polysaccharide synthesis protein n=1 Tax=Mannheimia varigena TaxID=85404 RepID=UPI0003E3113A|nr:capsular polysaccharide synthesis protein [Mannheimia varigena]AHG76948.1 Capsular polysaccharide synthesis [Mannheimia varigena USDA-ARS-USMARC-1312]